MPKVHKHPGLLYAPPIGLRRNGYIQGILNRFMIILVDSCPVKEDPLDIDLHKKYIYLSPKLDLFPTMKNMEC